MLEDQRKWLYDKWVMLHCTESCMLLRVAQEDVLVVLIIGLHYRPGGLIDTCVVFLIWSEDCILLLTILEYRIVPLQLGYYYTTIE